MPMRRASCVPILVFLKQQYFVNVHFPDEVRPVPRIGIRFVFEEISTSVEILAIDCLLAST